jgi:hypothetical protein
VGARPFQNTALPPKIVVERITRRLRVDIIVCETIMILSITVVFISNRDRNGKLEQALAL